MLFALICVQCVCTLSLLLLFAHSLSLIRSFICVLRLFHLSVEFLPLPFRGLFIGDDFLLFHVWTVSLVIRIFLLPLYGIEFDKERWNVTIISFNQGTSSPSSAIIGHKFQIQFVSIQIFSYDWIDIIMYDDDWLCFCTLKRSTWLTITNNNQPMPNEIMRFNRIFNRFLWFDFYFRCSFCFWIGIHLIVNTITVLHLICA